MDQEQLQQKIAEYYAKLPIEAQVMFASQEWMRTLENLSSKYSLTPLQIQTLGTETTLLLLGIVHPDEYAGFLKADLSLSADTQNKLMADINLGILNKWRTVLAEAYAKNSNEIAEKEYGGERKLDERFTSLPPEVQEAIANSNYQNELYVIANEEKLSIDQMGKLEKATNKILLGIEHPDKYTDILASELGLTNEKALEISSKVNEKILKNIRELLKSHAEVHAEIAVPIPPSTNPSPIKSAPINSPININIAPISEVKPVAEPKVVLTPMSEMKSAPTLAETSFMPKPIIEPITKKEDIVNTATTNTPEKKIFGESGIEMMQEVVPPSNLPSTENVINKEETMMQKSGVSIMEGDIEVPLPPMQVNAEVEKDTLSGIENPVATTPISMPKVDPVIPVAPLNVIQNKLSRPSVNIQSASDQSLPKMTNRDPYREVVE
jgi:hypothetical protein